MRQVMWALAVLLVSMISIDAGADTRALQESAKTAFGNHSGGAVIMRVSDGKILAIVNPKVSAIQLHPPGSVFKLVTGFAALQEGITSAGAKFRCSGNQPIGDVLLYCTTPNGHGTISFPEAIAQSCNVTFYGLGRKLGPKRLLKYARVFALDRKVPGYKGVQAVGHLPASPVIHPAQTAQMAVGQANGFKITLLEAAEMVRRIANGNAHVAGIDNSKTRRNLAVIRSAMRLAVISGTCKNAAVGGVEIAGKTGSPEAADDSDKRNGWFVGFAPYKKPEIVLVVFVNRGHGYDTAAPIARRIFSAYFGKENKR
ncbi:MAG: penicillin-binding transpeptidase domain-containing protein [Armatimonadetes bacterium]|nr:penicillin-binding transpeptidase domain-containing protein [Armatimonadota bacterium]